MSSALQPTNVLDGDYLEMQCTAITVPPIAPKGPSPNPAPPITIKESPTNKNAMLNQRRRNLQQLICHTAAFDHVVHSRPLRAPVSATSKTTYYKIINTNEDRTKVFVRSGVISHGNGPSQAAAAELRLTADALDHLSPTTNPKGGSKAPPSTIGGHTSQTSSGVSDQMVESHFWDPRRYLRSESEMRRMELSGAFPTSAGVGGDSVAPRSTSSSAKTNNNSTPIVGTLDLHPDVEGFVTAVEAIILPSSSSQQKDHHDPSHSSAASGRASTVGGASRGATSSRLSDIGGHPSSDCGVEVLLFIGTSSGTVIIADMCRPNDPCDGADSAMMSISERPLRVLLTLRMGDKWSLQENAPETKAFMMPDTTDAHLGSAAVCKFAVESFTSAARSNPNIYKGVHGKRGGGGGLAAVESVWIIHEDGAATKLPRSILNIITTGAARHTIPPGAQTTMLKSAKYRPQLMRDWHPESTTTPFAIAAVAVLGVTSGLNEALISQTTLITTDQQTEGSTSVLVTDVATCARCNTSPIHAVDTGSMQESAFVAVGQAPALGAYLIRAEAPSFTTGQVVSEIAGRLAGAAMGFVKRGWGWRSDPKKDAKPEVPTFEPLSRNTNIIASSLLPAGDANSESEVMTTVTVDPTHRFAACYTPLGRIYIFDLQSSLIIRVLKGCRAAECEWTLATVQGKKMLLLAVHLKFRGVVELFSMKRKRRVGAVKVGAGWSIIRNSAAFEPASATFATLPGSTSPPVMLGSLVLVRFDNINSGGGGSESDPHSTQLLTLTIRQKQQRGLHGLEDASSSSNQVSDAKDHGAVNRISLGDRKMFLFCEALLEPLLNPPSGSTTSQQEDNDDDDGGGVTDPVHRVVHACLSKCESPKDFFLLGYALRILLHDLLSNYTLPKTTQLSIIDRYITMLTSLNSEVRSVFSPGPNEDIAMTQPTHLHWERAASLTEGYVFKKQKQDTTKQPSHSSEGMLSNTAFVEALVKYTATSAFAVVEANHQQVDAAQVYNFFDLQRSLVKGYRSIVSGTSPKGATTLTKTTTTTPQPTNKTIAANMSAVTRKIVSFDSGRGAAGTPHYSAELIAVGAKLLAEEVPMEGVESKDEAESCMCAVFDFLELFWCGTYRLRFSFNSPSSSVGTPTPLRAGTHVRATLPASEGSQGSSSYLGGLQVFHVAYFTFQRLRYPVASVSLTQLGVPQSVVASLYVLWLVYHHPNTLGMASLSSAEEVSRVLTIAQLDELMQPIPLSILSPPTTTSGSSSVEDGDGSVVAIRQVTVGRHSLVAMAVLLACKMDQLGGGGKGGGVDASVAAAQQGVLNAFSRLAVLDLIRRSSSSSTSLHNLPLLGDTTLGDITPTTHRNAAHTTAPEGGLPKGAAHKQLILCELVDITSLLAHELHRVATWLAEGPSNPDPHGNDNNSNQMLFKLLEGDHDDHAAEWIHTSISAPLLPRTFYGCIPARIELFSGRYHSTRRPSTPPPSGGASGTEHHQQEDDDMEVLQALTVYLGGEVSTSDGSVVSVPRHEFIDDEAPMMTPSLRPNPALNTPPITVQFATVCQFELWTTTIRLQSLTSQIVPVAANKRGFKLGGEMISQLRDVLSVVERLHRKLRWAGLCDPCWERYAKSGSPSSGSSASTVTEEDRQRVLTHLLGSIVINAVVCSSLSQILAPLRVAIGKAAETSDWISERHLRDEGIFGNDPPTRHIQDYLSVCKDMSSFVGYRFAEDIVDQSAILRRAPALMQHDFSTSSWALYQVIGGITGYFSQEASDSSSPSKHQGQQRQQQQATSASSVGVEDTLGMFISWSIERDADRVFPHLSRPAHIDPLERLSSFVQQHRVVGSINILGDVFALVSLVGTMVAQSEGSKEVRSGAMSGLVEWSSMFDSTALGLLEDLHPDHTSSHLRNQLTGLGDTDGGLEGPAEGEEVDNFNEKVDAKYLSHQSSREQFLSAVVAAQVSCLVEKDGHQPFVSTIKATPLDAITQRSHELYEVLELRADGVVERALFEGAMRSGFVSQAMELYWGRMGSTHQVTCSTHILPVIITTIIHAIDTQLTAVREAKGSKNQVFARLSALSVEVASALGRDCIKWAEVCVSGGGDASGLYDDMCPWLATSWECYLSTLIPGSSTHYKADKDVFSGMKAFLSGLSAFATSAASLKGTTTGHSSTGVLGHLPQGVRGLVSLLHQ